tara:strand:+ start:4623 stop:5255 length:633 start_codon:yes stop_codon:yes gene_type:complete
MNGYNPEEFEDLDLPLDPLEEIPDFDALTYQYSDEARGKFLPFISDYDPFRENMLKNQAKLGAEQSQLKYESDKLAALNSLREVGKAKSKGGFSGAGAWQDMNNILVNSITSDAMSKNIGIASELISAKKGISNLREEHVDDLWGLYTDFLLTDPELRSEDSVGSYPVIGQDLGGFFSDILDQAGVTVSDIYESITPWNDDCPPWDWNCW